MLNDQERQELVEEAWTARGFADPNRSGVKVGAALLTDNGRICTGWNKEGLWMTSIHAEVAAISQMEVGEKIVGLAVVAETEFFTPCGACTDWIMKYATSSNGEVEVLIENKRYERRIFKLSELAPHYPRE